MVIKRIRNSFSVFCTPACGKIAPVPELTSQVCSWIWKFSLTFKHKTCNYSLQLTWKWMKLAVGWKTSSLSWFRAIKLLFHGPFSVHAILAEQSTRFGNAYRECVAYLQPASGLWDHRCELVSCLFCILTAPNITDSFLKEILLIWTWRRLYRKQL